MAPPTKLPILPAEIMLLITEYYFVGLTEDCTTYCQKSTCTKCGVTAESLTYKDLDRSVRHITLMTQNYLDMFPNMATIMYRSFDTAAIKAKKAFDDLGPERKGIYKGKGHEFANIYLLALHNWLIMRRQIWSVPWSKYGVRIGFVTQAEREQFKLRQQPSSEEGRKAGRQEVR